MLVQRRSETNRTSFAAALAFLVATEVDGVEIENALHLSRQSSRGPGFHIDAVPFQRAVPAGVERRDPWNVQT